MEVGQPIGEARDSGGRVGPEDIGDRGDPLCPIGRDGQFSAVGESRDVGRVDRAQVQSSQGIGLLDADRGHRVEGEPGHREDRRACVEAVYRSVAGGHRLGADEPARFRPASTTVTSCPAPRRCRPAESPASPAPITTTRAVGPDTRRRPATYAARWVIRWANAVSLARAGGDVGRASIPPSADPRADSMRASTAPCAGNSQDLPCIGELAA